MGMHGVYEIVRRRYAGRMMDLVRIPADVWREALEEDRSRQGWHGPKPKDNHWLGKQEQVLGNGAEIMARRYLDFLGIRGWRAAPLFNDKFHRPVDQGGSPDWDLEFLHGGESFPVDVKATGCAPRPRWVMRVKEEEYKPHPRLVFFATLMISLQDPTLGAQGRGGIRRLPGYMLPFHYIDNKFVETVPPTPVKEPFAPHKACRVFPFPGFVRSTAVTRKTTLGPPLKPLTREALFRMFGESIIR